METRGRKERKGNYYFFYRSNGKTSSIERYGSKSRIKEVLDRLNERGIILDKVFISNSLDFIQFLNRKPGVVFSRLHKETKLQASTLIRLTDGTLNMTKHYAAIISPVLNSYGWKTSPEYLLRGAAEKKPRTIKRKKETV